MHHKPGDADNQGDAHVLIVPPMSMSAIEVSANAVLKKIAPAHLNAAAPLDLQHLSDFELQRHGIFVQPIADEQLAGRYGETEYHGDPGDPINVFLTQTEWDDLYAGGRRAHHARGTLAHELGHVFEHVPKFRKRIAAGFGLPRRAQRTVRAYHCPEWQAWALGTCLLAPRSAIVKARTKNVAELAAIFETSTELMRLHLRRLNLEAA